MPTTWRVVHTVKETDRTLFVMDNVPAAATEAAVRKAIDRLGYTPQEDGIPWAAHHLVNEPDGVEDEEIAGLEISAGSGQPDRLVTRVDWPTARTTARSTHLRIPAELHRQVTACAKGRGMSLNVWCLHALRDKVAAETAGD